MNQSTQGAQDKITGTQHAGTGDCLVLWRLATAPVLIAEVTGPTADELNALRTSPPLEDETP